jgi:hypothetical protein
MKLITLISIFFYQVTLIAGSEDANAYLLKACMSERGVDSVDDVKAALEKVSIVLASIMDAAKTKRPNYTEFCDKICFRSYISFIFNFI